MGIWNIKTVDNTIFVVGNHKLVEWALEVDGVVHGAYSARRVTVDETLPTRGHLFDLELSHDCSQIAFSDSLDIFLYDVKT